MFRQQPLSNEGDEQIDTGWTGEGGRECCTSGATHYRANLLLHFGQTLGAPSPGLDHGGQTLGENAPRTIRGSAEETTDAEFNMG